jgi:hypothetical protein
VAEEKRKKAGTLRVVVLWLVIAALLTTVWWLASERNERRYAVSTEIGEVVVSRGRFFPTGTAVASEKMYAPVKVPAGEKPPAPVEFEDQNSLDRFLFDLFSGWAKAAAKRNDTQAAATLVDRASALPGLTGAQIADLTQMRADLAWDDAQADIAAAAKALESARGKLERVKQTNGAHAPDAAALQTKLQGIASQLAPTK